MPTRALGRVLALALALGAVPLLLVGVGPKPSAAGLFPDGPMPITLEARPLRGFDLGRPERTEHGRLRYLGGLDVTSDFRGFGGFSGLALRPDGSALTAVSDAGHWLVAGLSHDGARLTGLVEPRMGPLLDESGRPLSRFSADAEALALLPDGDALVAFESRAAIRRYALGREGLAARARPLPLPAGAARLRGNRGLEGLAVCPDGRRFAAAEAVRGGRAQGWIWREAAAAESLSIAVPDDFAVTDLACLEGAVLLLERRYTHLFDIAVRLRRLTMAELESGARGETLLEADLGSAIDNFEGLGVHRREGRVVLTLISDDNFSMLQRTLLLQFELLE